MAVRIAIKRAMSSGILLPGRINPINNMVRMKHSDDNCDDRPEIPKNLLTNIHTAHLQKENGEIYDKKPFKILLEKDKVYFWCLCGQGHNQPMCDNTHRNHLMNITLKPIRFKVAETKHYWLCNCKQTKNRPFCDGSHKSQIVQDACRFK